jgi:hypothetical protein
MKDSYSVDDSSDESSEEIKPVVKAQSVKLHSQPGTQSTQKKQQIVYSDPTATNPFISTNSTSPFAKSSGGTEKLTKSNPGYSFFHYCAVVYFINFFREKKPRSTSGNQQQLQQPLGNPMFESLLATSVPFTPTVSSQPNNNFGFATYSPSPQPSSPSPFMTSSGGFGAPFSTTTAFTSQQQPNPFATTTASPFTSPNPQPLFTTTPR